MAFLMCIKSQTTTHILFFPISDISYLDKRPNSSLKNIDWIDKNINTRTTDVLKIVDEIDGPASGLLFAITTGRNVAKVVSWIKHKLLIYSNIR